MNNKILIAIAGIVALAILGVGLMNYNAKIKVLDQKQEEAKEQRAKELRMNMMYEKCVKDSYTMYSNDWQGECQRLYNEDSCALPLYLSDRLDDSRSENESNCVKLFGN